MDTIRQTALCDILRILSPDEVEVLSHYFYECRSLSEIGQLFGVHKATIQTRINKLLAKLATHNIPLPQRLSEIQPQNRRKITATLETLEYLVHGDSCGGKKKPLIIDKKHENTF